MASGKTLAMKDFARKLLYREMDERSTVARDRSLRGKNRIRARKAENKRGK